LKIVPVLGARAQVCTYTLHSLTGVRKRREGGGDKTRREPWRGNGCDRYLTPKTSE
jgi:hypothetical protein